MTPPPPSTHTQTTTTSTRLWPAWQHANRLSIFLKHSSGHPGHQYGLRGGADPHADNT